jgi:hypothetical protein
VPVELIGRYDDGGARLLHLCATGWVERHEIDLEPPHSPLLIESVVGLAQYEAIVAIIVTALGRVGPANALPPRRPQGHHALTNGELDIAGKTSRLNHRSRQPDALRVADTNQLGLHGV